MKLLFTAVLIFASIGCFAQKHNTYFLKNNGKEVSTKDSADFIRIVSKPHSGAIFYNVDEYYLNGKRRFVGKSSNISPLQLQGAGLWLYPNGKRKLYANFTNDGYKGLYILYYPNGRVFVERNYQQVATQSGFGSDNYSIISCADSSGKAMVTDSNGYYIAYDNHFKKIIAEGKVVNGKRDSVWKGFDTTMKVKYTETYENGKFKFGTAIDSLGATINYKEREVATQYKGGIEAFFEYIGMTVRYPVYSREHKIQGKVLINFIIQTDGILSNIVVWSTPAEDLATESVRVIKSCTGWVTATRFGIPVESSFTVPINFTLIEQNHSK